MEEMSFPRAMPFFIAVNETSAIDIGSIVLSPNV
tara:strand:+ start:342 stop:443 length:102 start_codon:yes stop_codon:yes gene_type:complete